MAKALPSFDMDAWLATLPQPQRGAMSDLRDMIKEMVPNVVESKSYGLPAFKLGGRGFVCVNVWKKHCALYPMSNTVIADHRTDLAGYDCTKGTIKFQPEQPLSAKLVESIIKARLLEIRQADAKGKHHEHSPTNPMPVV
jgi:uncharacterized protein YdhG (YjbR/CyaY superfamily)